MAANAGANNHHLVGRGEATLVIEDDRFRHLPRDAFLLNFTNL